MRIALAQINPTVGAFSENAQKIIEFINRAKDRRCDLVVFPELALFGYWPADLLERHTVVEEQLKQLKKIAVTVPQNMGVLLGLVSLNEKKHGRFFKNSAVFIEKGKTPKFYSKELLPTYDVFDEYRHFEFGDVSKNILKYKGKNLLITICEDIWAWTESKEGRIYTYNPLNKLKGKKIDYVLNLSASPFSINKLKRRVSVVKNTAKLIKAPVVYVNLVGGQDEIVFDGGSFAIDKHGKTIAESVFFEEDLNIADFKTREGGKRTQKISQTEKLKNALVFGLREFVEKNGFKKVHLGLSGGIDSAVVACLAVDAVGSGRVSAYALPSEFNANESEALAQQLAKNLNINFKTISIQNIYDTFSSTLDESFGKISFGLMHENLQARIRGCLLMAIANQQNSLLLSTSNKSEYATGYSTLYGDMCGGLAPLGDLLKRQVYELADLYNREMELIPKRIIERPPTAELRPNQKDQDTLPPYDELDRIVEKIVEHFGAAKSDTEKWVLNKMYVNEFKRWQAPPILRVSDHAFGRGRRFPVTNKARV